jgi:hypothetical protein
VVYAAVVETTVESAVESTVDKLRLRAKGLPRGLRELSGSLRLLGELRERGWQLSVCSGRPVDRRGLPQPWMNYSAISVLASAIGPTSQVFEYGAGFSTRWFSQRAGCVHAVEHDREWFERVSALVDSSRARVRHIPSAGDLYAAPDDDRYVNAPASTGQPAFDVIVVDGIARRTCLLRASDFLARNGLLVLDDSEWAELRDVRRVLTGERGYVELVVAGPKSTMGHLTTTSFFVRK